MSLEYNKNLIPRAKELRKNATPQENELWYKFLRFYPIRFQRQKTIGQFIVDFYCHEARLIIELDGSQHYGPSHLLADSIRTQRLENRDLHVMRIPNNAINENFSGVCAHIDLYVRGHIPPAADAATPL